MFEHTAGSLAVTGQSVPWVIIIIAGVLVLLGIVIAVIRLMKRRSDSTSDEPANEDGAAATLLGEATTEPAVDEEPTVIESETGPDGGADASSPDAPRRPDSE